MNDVRDGNHLAIFEEYEFDKPLIRKKDFLIDNCIGVVDGSMILYELNKKIKIARQKSFLFFQIKNFENTIL